MPKEMAMEIHGTPKDAPAGDPEPSVNQEGSPQAGRARYWERRHKTNSAPVTEVTT